MNLSKQDRNGLRTITDLQRKYNFGKTKTNMIKIETKVKQIEEDSKIDSELSSESNNAVQNKVITEALNNKVDKVLGKQLSTNDFTDEHKEAIHSHSNKSILDIITQENINNWNNALNLIADQYNQYQTYNIGNYVIHNNNLYKCKTAISVAEEWNKNHWIKTTVMAEIIDLIS